MALTFSEFKKIVAPYAGRAGTCASAETTNLFARQVMQYLLFSGSTSAVRKICMLACKGCISLPPEVEVPIKARIDCKVAEIWSKWFTMHSGSDEFICPSPITSVMQESGTETPLVYALPDCGSAIGVLANCEEAEDAYIDIQGKDTTGREIYSTYKGENISGVRLSLKKGKVQFSNIKFGEITGVVKPITNGYVGCFCVDATTQRLGQFLADWSPMETRPSYRRWNIIENTCPPIAQVSMLCRVKLKDVYHDNDITLFDNELAILLAAQRVNSEINNDTQTALYKKTATEDILQKEAGYKRPTCTQVDIFRPLSGGSISNTIARTGIGNGYFGRTGGWRR